MSAPLFALKDICFSYQVLDQLTGMQSEAYNELSKGRELNQLNFELFAGERLGLIGGNGVGKTTLLHLMTGLVKPHKGEVHAFGLARRNEEDFYEVRCRAGLCFQNTDDQLFCPTVVEDVSFGPLNLGKGRAEALAISGRILAELGLAGFEDRVTHHLSGGEKRLVALASVLSMEPDVLLLDEPTSGLDDAACVRLIEVLNGLSQAKLIVSHDAEFLEAVTDKVYRLEEGQMRPG